MNRSHRSSRYVGILLCLAMAFFFGTAVVRYPGDLAIGAPGIGTVLFWIVVAAPFALYVYTFVKAESRIAVFVTLGAVIVSSLAMVPAAVIGGEAWFTSVGVAPFWLWPLCAFNFLVVLGFQKVPPNRTIEREACKSGTRSSS